MSVEDVDAYLAEESPEFFKEVSGIAADKSLTLEQIVVDDDLAAYHAEVDMWQNFKGPLKILYKVAPFMPKVTLKIRRWLYRGMDRWTEQWTRAKKFVHYLLNDGRSATFSKAKTGMTQFLALVKTSLQTFKKMSLKARLVFFASLLLMVTAVVVGILGLSGKLLPLIFPQQELFIASMADHATKAYDYNPANKNEQEAYLKNARAALNLLLTKRIFVNLKVSPEAPGNPMGAFEFYIEGMSSDVVIEIKDKESLILDLMRQVISEMTYEQLETDHGKANMTDRLQKEISRALTKGTVKAVHISTIILKP